MTDDNLQRLLNELTPQGVRPEVRPQVLEAVANELLKEKEKPSRRLRCATLATAASILLGIGMNVWVSKASERRMAQIFGPPPVSKQAMELAEAVEKITDKQTGQWVYRQMTASRPTGDGLVKYREILNELIREQNVVSKDAYHDTPEKDSEMDRDRTGSAFGDPAGGQCRVRLDYRCTA
jgi:hypothetical protein